MLAWCPPILTGLAMRDGRCTLYTSYAFMRPSLSGLLSHLPGNPIQVGYVCRSDGGTVSNGRMGSMAANSPFRNQSTIAIAIDPPRDRGGKATAQVIVGDRVVGARHSNQGYCDAAFRTPLLLHTTAFAASSFVTPALKHSSFASCLLRRTHLRLCLPECSCCRCSAVRGST